MRSFLVVLLAGSLLSGCVSGGFDSVKKTNQLQPGMTYHEVVQLLGEPKTSEMKGDALVSTFWLHQSWKGNVPYDLVFDAKSRILRSWSENKEKFEANQKELSQIAAILSPGAAGDGSGAAGPAGPNDPNLQRQIAGTWWGYSGSTERRIGLCPDGSYKDYRESGYSGRSSNQYGTQTGAWGTASQSGGSGSWTISGSAESGTIHVRYANGRSAAIKYRQAKDRGCLIFDGNTLCRTSSSCQ